MTKREYPNIENGQPRKVSEPVVAYINSSTVSLEEMNLSDEIFTACIKRAEDDFAHARCFSSAELRRIVKEERGWK